MPLIIATGTFKQKPQIGSTVACVYGPVTHLGKFEPRRYSGTAVVRIVAPNPVERGTFFVEFQIDVDVATEPNETAIWTVFSWDTI